MSVEFLMQSWFIQNFKPEVFKNIKYFSIDSTVKNDYGE